MLLGPWFGKVMFCFGIDGLNHIRVTPDPKSTTYRTVRDQLVARYGPPTSEDVESASIHKTQEAVWLSVC